MIYAVNKKTKEHRVVDVEYIGKANIPVVNPRLGKDWDYIQADADGWIEWSGGECPLPDDFPYESKSGRGQIIYAEDPQRDNWKTRLSHGIIAYRPILNHPKKPKEWRGPEDGLPPVGLRIEYTAIKPDGKEAIIPGRWYQGKIIAYNDGVVWTSDNGLRQLSNTMFRPIRTDRERWIASAEYAIEDSTGEPANSTHLGILFDAGLARLPEE